MKETIDRAKKALVGTAWFDIARQESVPGDSSREVFGMVSLRDPNSKVGKVTSNDRGRKGHFESPEVFLKIHPVLHMGKCILKSYIYIYIYVYVYIYIYMIYPVTVEKCPSGVFLKIAQKSPLPSSQVVEF